MPSYYFINDQLGENYVSDILYKEMKYHVTIFTNDINFIDEFSQDSKIFFRSDSGISSDILLLKNLIKEIDLEFKTYLNDRLYYLYNTSSSKYKSKTKKAISKLISKDKSSEKDIEDWLDINKYIHPKRIIYLQINDNHRDTPTFISLLKILLSKSSISKYNLDIILLCNSMLEKLTYYRFDNFYINFNQTEYLINDILDKIRLPKDITLLSSGQFQQIIKKNGKYLFKNIIKTKCKKDDSYFMNDFMIVL